MLHALEVEFVDDGVRFNKGISLFEGKAGGLNFLNGAVDGGSGVAFTVNEVIGKAGVEDTEKGAGGFVVAREGIDFAAEGDLSGGAGPGGS